MRQPVGLTYFVTLAFLLSFLFLAKEAQGGESETVLDSVEASLKMSLPDTIIISQPFAITLSVRVTGDVAHFNERPDQIKFFIPPCFQVDSGNVEWSGRIEKGSFVELSLVVKAISPCVDYFGGSLRTGCYDRTIVQYKTRNTIRTRRFHVLASAITPGDSIASKNSDFRVLDTFAAGPPPSMVSPKSLGAKRDVYTELSEDSLRSGRATIHYRTNVNNYFRIVGTEVIPTVSKQFRDPKAWRLDGADGSIKSYHEYWLKLNINEAFDSAYLRFEIDRDTLRILVLPADGTTPK